MRATLLIALVFGIGIATVATARAEGVGVVVTADATIQPQLAAQVEDWLRQRGHQLVAAPLRPDALGTMIDCFVIEDVACARKVFDSSSATPKLMFAKAEIAGTPPARDITILGYWFERGADPAAVRRTCTGCTDAAMKAIIDDVMSSLAGAARADVGTLEVTVGPVGATVTIDGKPAGASPFTLPLGPHVIEVSAPDHASERRQVTIGPGQNAALTVQLAPTAGRSTLPLFVIGGGAAVLAAGIVLFVTSEEDTGEKPEYRDTRAGGIALSAIGVAAIAAGTYLYLRGGTSDSAPAVAITPDHAYVGWVRTF